MSDQPKSNPTEQVESHPFWDVQPTAKQITQQAHQIQQIDPKLISDQTTALPPYIAFKDVDVEDPAQLKILHDFLAGHYVGASDGSSRFDYSEDFLKWWLGSQQQNLALSLVAIDNDDLKQFNAKQVDKKEQLIGGEMCGFISGLPMQYKYNGFSSISQSVDFLCVHFALRNSNLAPALIQELTRRSYKNHIFTAIFTAAFTARQEKPVIPPILTAKYLHKLLNPIKLSQCKFCTIPYSVTQKDFIERCRIPTVSPKLMKRFVKMTAATLSDCHNLLLQQQSKFVIQQNFSKKLFEKLFKCRDGVVQSFNFLSDAKKGEKPVVEAFASFYIVDSQMLDEKVRKLHKYIRNGYVFHYALNQEKCEINVNQLITMLMTEMNKEKIDVCTCLNIDGNEGFIKDLSFDAGDGRLCYHTFNLDWGKQELQPSELGVVLV